MRREGYRVPLVSRAFVAPFVRSFDADRNSQEMIVGAAAPFVEIFGGLLGRSSSGASSYLWGNLLFALGLLFRRSGAATLPGLPLVGGSCGGLPLVEAPTASAVSSFAFTRPPPFAGPRPPRRLRPDPLSEAAALELAHLALYLLLEARRGSGPIWPRRMEITPLSRDASPRGILSFLVPAPMLTRPPFLQAPAMFGPPPPL